MSFVPGGGAGLGTSGGGSPPPPSPPPGTLIQAPASIQTASTNGSTNQTFILRGDFRNQTCRPKAGQRFYAHSDGARMDGEFGKEIGLEFNNILNITVSGIEFLRYNDGGIKCWVGSLIENCVVHDCHGTGIGGGMEDQGGNEIRDCEVYECGSVAVLGHDSGGIKLSRAGKNTQHSYVHDCYVHDNIGNGIWWDVGSFHVDAEDNLIVHNGRKGLFQEKGYGPCYFRRNRVYQNGWESPTSTGPRYGNILNASSKDCHYEDNITWDAANKRGLSWYDRDDAPKFYTGNINNWHITGNTSKRNKLYGGDQRKFDNDSGSPDPQTSGGVVLGTGADADQFFAGSPP